jgi:hypothetical protein
MRRYFIFLILGMLSSVSCLKDTGNYKTTPVILPDIYIVNYNSHRLGDRVELIPEIDFKSLDSTQFSYQWIIENGIMDTIQVSKSRNLDYIINLSPGHYNVHFRIIHKEGGYFAWYTINLEVINPFSSGLIALVETPEGGDLSHFFFQENLVSDCIYSRINGRTLPLPINNFSGIHYFDERYGDPYLFLTHNEGTDIIDGNTFLYEKSLREIIQFPPADPVQLQSIVTGPYTIAIINKQLYFAEFNRQMPRFVSPMFEDYQAAPFALGLYSDKTNFVIYDNKHNRFLRANAYNSRLSPYSPSQEASQTPAFDLRNIGDSVLYGGYTTNNHFLFVLRTNEGAIKCVTISESPHLDAANLILDISQAPEIDQAKVFLSHQFFPIVIYATDRKLYSINYVTGTNTLMYTYPPGIEIADMKCFGSHNGSPFYFFSTQDIAIGYNEGEVGGVDTFFILPDGKLWENEPYDSMKGSSKILKIYPKFDY